MMPVDQDSFLLRATLSQAEYRVVAGVERRASNEISVKIHQLSPLDAVASLNSTAAGLSPAEVERRLHEATSLGTRLQAAYSGGLEPLGTKSIFTVHSCDIKTLSLLLD